MEGALATAASLSAGYTSKWPFHLNSKHGDKPLDLRVTHFQTNRILNGGYNIYIQYIYCIYIYIQRIFFCFSAWSSFPCYLLHFGAKTWLLAFGFWLLAFGFTWLHLALLGFTWLHLAYGSWLLVLVSLGFGFGRSLHLALGVCWVLVL